ncbi:hypothetical protein D3C75_1038130 [compost metagenome]
MSVSPPPWEWPSLAATRARYCAASRLGSCCRKATMPQMCSSPMLLPQAGMPLALMPCLMIQKATDGLPLAPICARLGGAG